ncbi:MAG TPA: SDR family oxidoreductase [Bdellovibrionota bacterium]|nr:SDR family oxidoreductase [Bdellovibrionota bacterium]
MTDNLTPAQKDGLLKGIPLARWAEPEGIASVVQFLASERASNITGQVIGVNRGMYL